MAYGIDFRKRVLAYVEEGHTRQETAKLFNISTNTLYTWENNRVCQEFCVNSKAEFERVY